MSDFDLTPFYRTGIGFDRLFRSIASLPDASGFPHYDIDRTGEDSYRLTLAAAGMSEDDIEITVKDNTLTIKGTPRRDEEGVTVLYRGISNRGFERRFVLADHMVVEGASMGNGLLHIGLKRVVPEEMKPRRIPITAGPRAAIEDKAKKAA